MEKNLICDECDGKMLEGFVLNQYLPSIWVEGKPELSFWSGLKTKGRTKYLISAYRCEQCGFLKFYTALQGSNQ